MEGLQFPISSNNKIGVKYLTNLHLKLTDKGISEAISIVDVEEEASVEGEQKKEEEKEKEDKKEEEEDQEPVPTDVNKEEEVGSKGEQKEV